MRPLPSIQSLLGLGSSDEDDPPPTGAGDSGHGGGAAASVPASAAAAATVAAVVNLTAGAVTHRAVQGSDDETLPPTPAPAVGSDDDTLPPTPPPAVGSDEDTLPPPSPTAVVAPPPMASGRQPDRERVSSDAETVTPVPSPRGSLPTRRPRSSPTQKGVTVAATVTTAAGCPGDSGGQAYGAAAVRCVGGGGGGSDSSTGGGSGRGGVDASGHDSESDAGLPPPRTDWTFSAAEIAAAQVDPDRSAAATAAVTAIARQQVRDERGAYHAVSGAVSVLSPSSSSPSALSSSSDDEAVASVAAARGAAAGGGSAVVSAAAAPPTAGCSQRVVGTGVGGDGGAGGGAGRRHAVVRRRRRRAVDAGVGQQTATATSEAAAAAKEWQLDLPRASEYPFPRMAKAVEGGSAGAPVGPLLLTAPAGAVARGVAPPQAVVPSRVHGFLLPYQREGVSFLYGLYAQGVGGLLADDMGLGKTVMAAVFLCVALGGYPPESPPAATEPVRPAGRPRVALLVVPTSVRDNWRKELAIWTPLRVAAYSRSTEATIETDLRAGKLDVVIAGYEALVLRTETFFRRVRWALLVLDEVHRVKNHKRKAYEVLDTALTGVPLRYGLTGTPVQNNLRELHTLLSVLVRNGRWPEWKSFNRRYVEAITAGRAPGATPAEVDAGRVAVLRLRDRLLARFMLRRDKALIEDKLHGKDDQVFSMRMAPGGLQAAAYRAFLSMYDVVLLRRGKEPCDCGSEKGRAKCCYTHPTTPDELARSPLWVALHTAKHDGAACAKCPYCITFLAVSSAMRLADHVLLLRPRADDTPEGQARDRALCAYLFPDVPHLNPPLPAANDESDGGGGSGGSGGIVTSGGMGTVGEFLFQTDMRYCIKIRSVAFLLDRFRRDGHKTIIFSEKVRLLECLENYLTTANYSFLTLTGRVRADARQEMIAKFNTDPTVMVLLMSTKAGGVGLSVTSASRVILFDISWNPTSDLQAQDRAYRLGQTRKVKVYRLITAYTVEEYQYRRQLAKQQLSVTVLDDPDQEALGEVDDEVGCASLFSLAAKGLGVAPLGGALMPASGGAADTNPGRGDAATAVGPVAVPFWSSVAATGTAVAAVGVSPSGIEPPPEPLSTQQYMAASGGLHDSLLTAAAATASTGGGGVRVRSQLQPDVLTELLEVRPDHVARCSPDLEASGGSGDGSGGGDGDSGGGGDANRRSGVRFAPTQPVTVPSPTQSPPSPCRSDGTGSPASPTRCRRRRRRVPDDTAPPTENRSGSTTPAAVGSSDADSDDLCGLLPADVRARAAIAETQAVTDYLCVTGVGGATHLNTSTDPTKAGVIRAYNDARRRPVQRTPRPACEGDTSDDSDAAPPVRARPTPRRARATVSSPSVAMAPAGTAGVAGGMAAAAVVAAATAVAGGGGGRRAATKVAAAAAAPRAATRAAAKRAPPPKSARTGGAFVTVAKRKRR